MAMDEWVKRAFEEAQPMVAGMTLEEFSKHMDDCIREVFPKVMCAFEDAYGKEKAMSVAVLMLRDTGVFTLARCFFTAGYKFRVDEEEEGGKGDEGKA